MTTRRNFIKKGTLGLAALAINPSWAKESFQNNVNAQGYISKRPTLSKRNFTSKAVEETISRIKAKIKDCNLTIKIYIWQNSQINEIDIYPTIIASYSYCLCSKRLLIRLPNRLHT